MTADIFSVEDTTEKCYRDITSSLIGRGLKMLPYRKKSKLDRRYEIGEAFFFGSFVNYTLSFYILVLFIDLS